MTHASKIRAAMKKDERALVTCQIYRAWYDIAVESFPEIGDGGEERRGRIEDEGESKEITNQPEYDI